MRGWGQGLGLVRGAFVGYVRFVGFFSWKLFLAALCIDMQELSCDV